jgi:hypothetical protein
MTQTPTLAQLIKQAIENRMLDVHTAIIAKVERYDHQKQLVDVSPVLKRQDENLPMLCDVPVLFPRAGGFFISLPIQPGDFVQVIFNESAIDDFLAESASSIDSVSRFSLQGAVVIPGIFPQSMALKDAHQINLVLGKENGVHIHIDGEKIRLGSDSANEALALAKKVHDELQKIHQAFASHVHSYHATLTTTLLSPIGDIASKKVVAE